MTLIPSLTLAEIRVVFKDHLQRVWRASRERLHSHIPGSVPLLGLAYAPIVETSFSELAVYFLDFSP